MRMTMTCIVEHDTEVPLLGEIAGHWGSIETHDMRVTRVVVGSAILEEMRRHRDVFDTMRPTPLWNGRVVGMIWGALVLTPIGPMEPYEMQLIGDESLPEDEDSVRRGPLVVEPPLPPVETTVWDRL